MSTTEPGGRAPWRTVVVDDQALLVSAFEMLLSAQPDLEVAGTAADGAAALALLRSQARGGAPADVVLMDIRMPVMDGVAAIRAMRGQEALRRIPVLVLTTFDDDELVLAALRAGANGFLLKDASPRVLLEAVRTVARGGAWLDPAVTGTVLSHLSAAEEQATPSTTVAPATGREPEAGAPDDGGGRTSGLFEPLTGRERDVLSLVCDGLPNAEIGKRLHLAESTIKTHVKALLAKTGCRNRVELIVHAFRHRLAAPR